MSDCVEGDVTDSQTTALLQRDHNTDDVVLTSLKSAAIPSEQTHPVTSTEGQTVLAPYQILAAVQVHAVTVEESPA